MYCNPFQTSNYYLYISISLSSHELPNNSLRWCSYTSLYCMLPISYTNKWNVRILITVFCFLCVTIGCTLFWAANLFGEVNISFYFASVHIESWNRHNPPWHAATKVLHTGIWKESFATLKTAIYRCCSFKQNNSTPKIDNKMLTLGKWQAANVGSDTVFREKYLWNVEYSTLDTMKNWHWILKTERWTGNITPTWNLDFLTAVTGEQHWFILYCWAFGSAFCRLCRQGQTHALICRQQPVPVAVRAALMTAPQTKGFQLWWLSAPHVNVEARCYTPNAVVKLLLHRHCVRANLTVL